jgi:dephospho-CoA kinase
VEGASLLSPSVIVLAGRIGAGKSTLASALHNLTGFPIISFGKYVKKIAVGQNISLSRENLQNLGERLVERDAYSFTRCALDGIDLTSGIVIDGLRHRSVLEVIRSLAGEIPVLLIFIQIEDRVRSERLLARGMSHNELEHEDMHIMEKHVLDLLPIADVLVDGAFSLDANTTIIMRCLPS